MMFMLSCRTSPTPTIHVDIDDVSSPKISIQRVIPLETSSNNLIGNELDATFATYNSNIYILEGQHARSLMLFDSTGTFVRKTDYGKAPGEMLAPADFFIDSAHSKLLVWDSETHKMQTYSTSLHYQGGTSIDMVLRNFAKLPNGNWLVRSAYNDCYGKSKNEESKYYYYFIYSVDFRSIVSKILPFTNIDRIQIWLINPIGKTESPLFCTQFDMNLYTINSRQELEAVYYIDFGKYSPPKTDNEMPIDYYYRQQEQGQFVAELCDIYSTNAYLSVLFLYTDKLYNLIYSKRTNRTYTSKAWLEHGLLPNGSIKAISSSGQFTLMANAADYVTFCQANGTPTEVKPTDNPVLIYFTIEEE